MDVAARLSSKGQLTLPKAVREALGVQEGDQIVFRVGGAYAMVGKSPDFLAMAGSVPVPATKRSVAWDDIIRRTRAIRAARRRFPQMPSVCREPVDGRAD